MGKCCAELIGRCSIVGALLFPPLVAAELTIIYDSGDTRTLAPLLEVFAADEQLRPRGDPRRPDLGAADLTRLLPTQSPGLTPSKVERRPINQEFARPFFLIGSDPVSREWLAIHRNELLRIGAVGMLVQAETTDDLRIVSELANGLPLLPASATDIARALGLSHYPVLISNQGIEQ